jgi:hypothetical protein
MPKSRPAWILIICVALRWHWIANENQVKSNKSRPATDALTRWKNALVKVQKGRKRKNA